MAITLVRTPDLYALTKGGRMTFQFTGDGRLATLGTPAVSTILISGAVANGTRIACRWNGQTHEIVARTTPAAANEFAAGNGSQAYADSLVEFFETYFPFREDFLVSRADLGSLHLINLTARKPGPAYNISAPAGIPGIEVTQATLGAEPLIRAQYSVYVELWLQKINSSAFERIYQAPIETDATGLATFDAGDVLHAKLLADLPNWALNSPTKALNSQRVYYIAYGEAFGSPLQVGRMQQDNFRQAYLGGADYEHRAASGFDLKAFVQTGATAASDRALRFGSKTRYVQHNEPQYLTFLNTRLSQENVILNVYLKFTDDTVLSVDNLYASQAFPEGAKLTYPVGPQQLNLASLIPAGKTLLEYYIKLKLPTVDISQQYRFVINGQYEPYTRYFGYLSSLGVIETLATFGKGSSELGRFYEQAERFMPTGYSVQQGQFVHYDQGLQVAEDVTTGFREAAELAGWNDFYRSPERFRLVAGKALPIGITSKSIKQAKDGDTLFAHKWEYQYLYRNDFYTATDSDELLGDGYPPPGFLPTGGGSLVISQPQVINSVDATVPDAARQLTAEKLSQLEQSYGWGNHATKGYLRQAEASDLFLRQDEGIDYQTQVVNKPTTRDTAGLTDVPTHADITARLAGDLEAKAGTTEQRGTYYYRKNADQTENMVGFIGIRSNDTIALQDLKNGVNVTSEPAAADKPAYLAVNGSEVITRATLPPANAGGNGTDPKPLIAVFASSVGTGVGAVDNHGFAWQIGQKLAYSHRYANFGKPGSRTDQWLAPDELASGRTSILGGPMSVLEVFLADNRPSFALLVFSLGNEWDVQANHSVGAQTLLTNLFRMAMLCHQYKAHPIICTPYPRNQFGLNDQAILIATIKRLSTFNARQINLNSLLNNGLGQFRPGFDIGDGLHPTPDSHQYMADCVPLEYFFSAPRPGFPRKMDRLQTGIKITSATAILPIWLPVNTRSFTVFVEVKKEASAGQGMALISFPSPGVNNLRVRYNESQISLAIESAVILIRSNVAVTTEFQSIAVAYNHATGVIALFVNGVGIGEAQMAINQFFDRVALGGRPDGVGNTVGYSFRNWAVYKVPLESEQILDLHNGLIPQSSLICFAPLSEGNPTFAGQRFENLTGLLLQPATTQDETLIVTPEPVQPNISIGDIWEYVLVTEDHRVIVGSANISEGTTKNYQLKVYLTNGDVHDHTLQATPYIENGLGGETIADNGDLTIANNQVLNDTHQIFVCFNDNGVVTKLPVTVQDASTLSVQSTAIVGDSSISEGQNKLFVLEQTMTDGSKVRPASGVTWPDNDPHAGSTMLNGNLAIAANQTLNDSYFKTIYAVYQGVQYQKVVQVLDASTPPPTRVSVAISGVTAMNESEQKVMQAIATLSNGQTEVVPNSECVWNKTSSRPGSVIDTNGLFTVLANQTVGDGYTETITLAVGSLTDTHQIVVTDTTPPPSSNNSIVKIGWGQSDAGSDFSFGDTFFVQTTTTEGAVIAFKWAAVDGSNETLTSYDDMDATAGYGAYQWAHTFYNSLPWFEVAVMAKRAGGTYGPAIRMRFTRPASPDSVSVPWTMYPEAYQLTADSPGRNAARNDTKTSPDLNRNDLTNDTSPDMGALNS